jgi:hypothetical protein
LTIPNIMLTSSRKSIRIRAGVIRARSKRRRASALPQRWRVGAYFVRGLLGASNGWTKDHFCRGRPEKVGLSSTYLMSADVGIRKQEDRALSPCPHCGHLARCVAKALVRVNAALRQRSCTRSFQFRCDATDIAIRLQDHQMQVFRHDRERMTDDRAVVHVPRHRVRDLARLFSVELNVRILERRLRELAKSEVVRLSCDRPRRIDRSRRTEGFERVRPDIHRPRPTRIIR